MGLLDMLQSDDPAVKQGLIQFGLGLLSSKGNFGNALGNAGQQGLAGALGYRDRQAQQKRAALQDKLTQGQIAQQGQQQKTFEQQQAEWARQQELRNLPGQFVTQGMKPDTMDNRDVGMPGEQAIPTGFDQTGYLNALKGKDFNAWLTTSAALQKPASKFSTTPHYDQDGNAFVLDEQGNRKPLEGVKARDKVEFVNGVAVNPYATPAGTVGPQNPNQPFTIGPDGKITPNEPYQQFAQRTAKAGASNISMKVDNKVGEGLAAQVGPMVKDSGDVAQAAQLSVQTADSIIKAIDSGKVYTGPLASTRMRLAQWGQTLGVGGKDTEEQIANTRVAIQGLAQSTLNARGQLKGQGSVTESEGKLVERAASGDIDNMTAAEIKIVANVNKRLGQQLINNHKQLLNKVRKNPAAAGIADMFDIPDQGGAIDFGSLK